MYIMQMLQIIRDLRILTLTEYNHLNLKSKQLKKINKYNNLVLSKCLFQGDKPADPISALRHLETLLETRISKAKNRWPYVSLCSRFPQPNNISMKITAQLKEEST